MLKSTSSVEFDGKQFKERENCFYHVFVMVVIGDCFVFEIGCFCFEILEGKFEFSSKIESPLIYNEYLSKGKF